MFLVMLALASAGAGCAADPAPPSESSPPPADTAPALDLSETPPPGLSGRVVFHSDRDGRPKLYAIDLATRAIAPLTEGPDHRDEEPAASPDGARIAFATTRFGPTYDIAVADASGGGVRRLTDHAAFDRHPAWTADGRGLFFSSERDGTQAVFVIALDTGTIARVSPGPERALLPAAGPGPDQITYTQGTPEGLHLVLHDLRTGADRQLTHGAVGAARGRWSPDGTRLVYTRLVPGTPLLEVLDSARGRTDAFRVAGATALDDAAWSPDGRFLVAAARGDGGRDDWDLVVLTVGGEPPGAFRLTSGRGSDRAPSWSVR